MLPETDDGADALKHDTIPATLMPSLYSVFVRADELLDGFKINFELSACLPV